MSSASALPPRQVIVDDTDPSIQYNAQDWFVADPGALNNGNFGEIYNNTSHATTSSNARFTLAILRSHIARVSGKRRASRLPKYLGGTSATLIGHTYSGTSATLIGHTSREFPPNASSGAYFIDGEGPTPFTLPGRASATSGTNFNRLFFTTPSLA
ncbi:hypothetical protein FB45DRAFT_863226 [Roridomyces roridus]|uniref:Uncharacterized protein n=1 Tax=Roridomyces roridus TaxID=1738132 RepID=A0AAD7C944_9AGAR|nr:hypothetical protein FB45DRAFT_863226 [Roridomyces roridus]